MHTFQRNLILIASVTAFSALFQPAQAQVFDGGKIFSKHRCRHYSQPYHPCACQASDTCTLQLGLTFSYLHTWQRAHLDEFFATSSNRLTANQAALGVLYRMLLTPFYGFRPTATFDIDKILSPSLYIINEDFGGGAISSVRVNNNWIARFLVGLESPLVCNLFSAGVGVGVANLNHSLDTMTFGSHFSKSQNAIIPTGIAYLTYYTCAKCLMGSPLSISLQGTADRYPSFSAYGINQFTATPVRSKLDQHWQYTGSVVLATNINLS